MVNWRMRPQVTKKMKIREKHTTTTTKKQLQCIQLLNVSYAL